MLVAAGGLHALTLTIFLYLVVFLPWLRGYMPNVSVLHYVELTTVPQVAAVAAAARHLPSE